MSANTRGDGEIRSNIARASADAVSVHGNDLVSMLGEVGLGDFAYLSLFRRLPDERESRLFNAIVVALVEHGLTPSALVTRLTILGAPESLQGAVAAGLLGLGDTFVGTIEGAARLCAPAAAGTLDEKTIGEMADTVLEEHARTGRPVPGLGHPVHKPVDPRAQRLFAISRELGFEDSPIRLMEHLSAEASTRRGTVLPVNVTGAIGATSAQLGVPAGIARGLGVMARAIGLVGHLLEESELPLAATVWTQAERAAQQSERH